MDLFQPSEAELKRHVQEGGRWAAWGVYRYDKANAVTPLRQNIVLFMAAMNGEL